MHSKSISTNGLQMLSNNKSTNGKEPFINFKLNNLKTSNLMVGFSMDTSAVHGWNDCQRLGKNRDHKSIHI
jgi:hypothetical protein